MKIKVYMNCGICAIVTYLKADGFLEFLTNKSGILHTQTGPKNFEVVN